MKKLLLPILFCLPFVSMAQADCDPMAHDFGTSLYGVYPDTITGLQDGVLNQAYNQTIYILVPNDATVIDPTLGAFATLDQVSLAGISYVNANGDTMDISTLGLTLECNPANCSFQPGQQYCGVISGIPNQVGEFPVVIEANVDVLLFGTLPSTVPFNFDGYTFTVTATASILSQNNDAFGLGLCMPNPANESATINYTLSNTDQVSFTMVNMVGERVIAKNYVGKRGDNMITIDVAELPAGIYLYTVQSGSKKATRKLVVQH